MDAILKGTLVGLSMIVFLGPVFFMLLQTTLQKGTRPGIAVALGIFLSDNVVVLLCAVGIEYISDDFFNNKIFLFLSFIILFSFGVKYLTIKTKAKSINTTFNKRSFFNFLSLGFLVNFLNPFVFVVWFGVLGYTKTLSYTSYETRIFFISALLSIFFSDLLKVLFARKLKSFLSLKHLGIIYKAIGFVMLTFSFRILYLAFS